MLDDKKEEKKDDKNESDYGNYPTGWDDDAVKAGLLLISMNNVDKSARDSQNQEINEILKEASVVGEPTAPRYIGAKKAKQCVAKTKERIQPLKWKLQGDGSTEEEEILVTMALKEALHRGGYDSTYTGKGGIIDGILNYGDKYRLIVPRDDTKSAFPVGFEIIDSNNIWMNTNATSFRDGNKNVTQLVVLFKGTKREFEEKFPQYDDVPCGLIPRNFTYKDLDQTNAQKFKQVGAGTEEQQEIEWAYIFDSSKRTYRLIAGAELSILEAKDDKEYPYVFKNIEDKEEAYLPVGNHMCMPSEEGIYNVGLVAYIYDLCVGYRRTFNQIIGHVEENTHPHTLVNIPQGQEETFVNLIETANQVRAAGKPAYVPITFTPGQTGAISSAQPLLNGGDLNGAKMLLEMYDNELRKCGVYMDEPIQMGITATQVEYNASNALTLPKSIMKYNAPTVEFEITVAIDMYKKLIKNDDKTPLILDSQVELPSGPHSTKGVPYSLGWLKLKLLERAWRVDVDDESGAKVNENMTIALYTKLLPTLQPGSPEYVEMARKLALASGVDISPVKRQALEAKQAAMGAQGGQPDMAGMLAAMGKQMPNMPSGTAMPPNPSQMMAAGVSQI